MTAMGSEKSQAREFRVRGCVQGVGFRPAVWRIANDLGLAGEVLNDAEGVLLRVDGDQRQVAVLLDRIRQTLPPLARIDRIESRSYGGELPVDFRIAESEGGEAHTQISPDAGICASCIEEMTAPNNRRYRYPFTTCTHCGPRLTIVKGIPYDRATTTMAKFLLCEACNAEYRNPHDRRFHAEAIACPACGPKVALIALDETRLHRDPETDDVDLAAAMIRQGTIIALKGLGGYHLACDATNASAVARLRRLKRRDAKPFALMARDIEIVRRYCTIDMEEERQLESARAPIVLLHADGPQKMPGMIAPGLRTLGFMLPTTPLHLLLVREMDGPLVMTSGNLSEEPPVTEDTQARQNLAGIAAYALMHDRDIANRIDDSVVRVMDGKARVLRRARGYAPAPIDLPAGFDAAPELLAMGGELKSTFCLIKDGQAILSEHQGDLENAATFDDYRKNLALYRQLFDVAPAALVVDRHPEYLSSKLGRAEARQQSLPVIEVQHHHAHVAACLAENDYPLAAPAVLGIVLDGLGFGDDGTIWGGELLLADYHGYDRLARLKPVPMPGGAQAVREPWRNLYAHLISAIGWQPFTKYHSHLELHGFLRGKPLALLDAMMRKAINAPEASSCGRLFDAVAAALGVCRERQAYEGQAGASLETLAEAAISSPHDVTIAYRFEILQPSGNHLFELDPSPMWQAVLSDLESGTSAAVMALRFHNGFANALVKTVKLLAVCETGKARFDTVALSGGCFQNRILFGAVAAQLRDAGFAVLTHAQVPANDGGLSLGQAAIGAAHLIKTKSAIGRDPSCVSAFQAASSA